MKKIILIFSFLTLLISAALAQTPPARTWYNNKVVKERWYENANGQKHGKYIAYYEDGSMHFYANYTNDELNGLLKYSDGNYETYKMGVRHGQYLNCSIFGCEKGNFVNGEKDGYWKGDDKTGSYIKGNKAGFWIENYGKSKGNYVNGIKNGYWIEDEGKRKGNYVNGKRDGKWIEITESIKGESGTVTGNYSKGVRIGKWENLYNINFVQDGVDLNSNFSYKDGYATIFDNNGKVIDVLDPNGISERKKVIDEIERINNEKERIKREENAQREIEFQKRVKANKFFKEIENDISKNISDNYRCEIYNKYYPNEKEQLLKIIERKIDSSFNISFNYNSLIPSFFGQMHIINYIKAINEYNSKISSPIETIYVITHVRVGPSRNPSEQYKELSELTYNRCVFLTKMIYHLNPGIKVIALPTLNEIKDEPGCIFDFDPNNNVVKDALRFSKQIISKYGDITINSNYIVDKHYESAERDIINYINKEADLSTQSYENNFRRIPVEYMYFYTNKYPNELIYNSLIPAIKNGKKAIDNIVELMNEAIKKNNLDPNKYPLSAFTFAERVDNERYK